MRQPFRFRVGFGAEKGAEYGRRRLDDKASAWWMGQLRPRLVDLFLHRTRAWWKVAEVLRLELS